MSHHELKIWPEFYNDVRYERKSFEIRKNDRNYEKGDTLTLKEWNPDTQTYTGRSICRRIIFLMEGGRFGLETGYVAMTIR